MLAFMLTRRMIAPATKTNHHRNFPQRVRRYLLKHCKKTLACYSLCDFAAAAFFKVLAANVFVCVSRLTMCAYCVCMGVADTTTTTAIRRGTAAVAARTTSGMVFFNRQYQ